MYWDIDVTPEEEEELIGKIAQKIHKFGLDVIAIFMIEGFKPLSFIGAQIGRFVFSPFLPVLGENVGVGGEKFLQTFEKHENVERLIKAVEELAREEEEEKKAEKVEKKGWRRFIPF